MSRHVCSVCGGSTGAYCVCVVPTFPLRRLLNDVAEHPMMRLVAGQSEIIDFHEKRIAELNAKIAEQAARIATLEEALKRVHRLVCFEMAEPPEQGTGTLVAVATVVEEALGQATAERGGL